MKHKLAQYIEFTVSILFINFIFFSLSSWAVQSIKVGLIDSYSGPSTAYTYDIRDAFKLVIDQVNAKDGLLGKTIELTTRDDKFKVDIGLSMAKELIMREKVDIIVGTSSSAVALAISGFAKEEKKPFFVTNSKSDKIIGYKGHRYVFSITENTTMASKAAAEVMSKKKYVKYWVAGDDYEYGHTLGNAMWHNLKKQKPQVVELGESWWKLGESDLTPYLTAIMAAKPDAVIFATGSASMINLMKAVKATGFANKIPMLVHTSTEHGTLMPLGQNASSGVYGTSSYHFYFPNTPENRSFVKTFKDAYGRYPNAGALYGYLAAQFIVNGFKKAGEVNIEKFIDSVEGMKITSPVGKIEMRKCDHQAVLPMFLGVTTRSAQYPFFVATGIVTIPGSKIMPSCQDIMKVREKSKY